MAETTATTRLPCLRVAVMSSATCRRPSGVASNGPPNFWMMTLMMGLPGGRLGGHFRRDKSHLDQVFRDLHGVQRSALPQIVSHGEEGQATGFIGADSADETGIASGRRQRRGNATRGGVVHQFHAGRGCQELSCLRRIQWLLELGVDRDTVGNQGRHSYAGDADW